MTVEMVTEILSDMFITVLYILVPILGASLVIGIMISIFQAVTSIQEMTLTFVPKILVTAIMIILLLPWIAEKLIDFTLRYYSLMETITRP